jgi:hypothetical protein
MKEMTRIQCLKEFFGGIRPVTITELKELSGQDRKELADLAAIEMGVTIIEKSSSL